MWCKKVMILVQFQNVYKEYNGEKLFAPFTFDINEKERIAIIGPNGTGKSTLIKMLLGEVTKDGGVISLSKDLEIGYLSQSVISDLGNTLYDEALLVFKDLIKMENDLASLCEKMALSHSEEDLEAYSKLENRFKSLGGYDYRYKIDMMLSKFGFYKEDFARPIASFSGGERMKMAFAKLLLIKPNLLVLDEPTNHLDIATIEWLETYLKTYEGSILFVSHDRYFINSLANKILEIDQKRVEVYVGDYDKYSALKKERYEQRLKLYKSQQKEVEKLKWFINFYMPKPRFVSRAHDREKKLARLEKNLIDKPYETKNKVNINIQGSIRKGKRLVEIKEVSIGYDKPLINDINITIFGGDKVAIMGQNGCGKTTFIKNLLKEMKPLKGRIDYLTNLNIGYLKQDGINISSKQTIFEFFKDRFPLMSDQAIYDHLGKYAFSFEDDQKVIDNLSGGERMRVVFAELVLHNYDMIFLDEPTNHLDMLTKEELIDSLKEYEGSLVIVSHDRYFVDQVSNKFLYFTDHISFTYEGRYSSFKEEVLDEYEKEKSEKEVEVKETKDKYVPTHEVKRRPKLALNKIEEKMARIEKKLEDIHLSYEKEECYSSKSKMQELEQLEASLNKEYEELMEELSLYDQ